MQKESFVNLKGPVSAYIAEKDGVKYMLFGDLHFKSKHDPNDSDMVHFKNGQFVCSSKDNWDITGLLYQIFSENEKQNIETDFFIESRLNSDNFNNSPHGYIQKVYDTFSNFHYFNKMRLHASDYRARVINGSCHPNDISQYFSKKLLDVLIYLNSVSSIFWTQNIHLDEFFFLLDNLIPKIPQIYEIYMTSDNIEKDIHDICGKILDDVKNYPDYSLLEEILYQKMFVKNGRHSIKRKLDSLEENSRNMLKQNILYHVKNRLAKINFSTLKICITFLYNNQDDSKFDKIYKETVKIFLDLLLIISVISGHLMMDLHILCDLLNSKSKSIVILTGDFHTRFYVATLEFLLKIKFKKYENPISDPKLHNRTLRINLYDFIDQEPEQCNVIVKKSKTYLPESFMLITSGVLVILYFKIK